MCIYVFILLLIYLHIYDAITALLYCYIDMCSKTNLQQSTIIVLPYLFNNKKGKKEKKKKRKHTNIAVD